MVCSIVSLEVGPDESACRSFYSCCKNLQSLTESDIQFHLILPMLCLLGTREVTLQRGWAESHAEGAKCTLIRASLAAAAAAEEPLG